MTHTTLWRLGPCAIAGLALVISLLAWMPAWAQDKPAGAAESPSLTQEQRREQEFKAAIEAVAKVAKPGPASIPLIDQGTLSVPDGYIFVAKSEGAQLLRAMGNRTGPNFLGLLLSATDKLNWFATLTYNKTGYVKDDDARDWKADELLSQLREGTEEGNTERVQRGFAAIEVSRWIAPPAYDAATHRLVWSALVRDKGDTSDDQASVNYNTYALGREGFFQLNLITGAGRIEGDKRHAGPLLAAIAYADGKRYEDFQPGTDKVAQYGLAALVAGAAAKKLGLFAVILAFILKGWKLAAVALIGGGALASRLFKRKA